MTPPDGDLAALATSLWMQFEFLDPVITKDRQLEIWHLQCELKSHIDPEGSMQAEWTSIRNQKKAKELRQQGKERQADLWLLPRDQWKQPNECSRKDWLKIIKPFNREEYNEPIEEFLANVELARARRIPSEGTTAVEALNHYQEDAHTKIRQMVNVGASSTELQEFINQQPKGYNQIGLAKYAEQCRIEIVRRQDLTDALEDLLLRGEPPTISLADYVPASWLPMFRVLQEGLKFSDEAIVMTVMAGVVAVLPPSLRIKGWSLEEIPAVWLFLIGVSGTAKSVLLKMLINLPMAKSISAIDAWNKKEMERRRIASEAGEEVLAFRKRNLIYTAPTTQGIRADLAEQGEDARSFSAR